MELELSDKEDEWWSINILRRESENAAEGDMLERGSQVELEGDSSESESSGARALV